MARQDSIYKKSAEKKRFQPYTHRTNEALLRGSSDVHADVRAIRSALSDLNPHNVNSALYTLQQRFNVKRSELPISRDDPRLRLAKAWLETSSGAPELFDIWRKAPTHSTVTTTTTMLLLATMLFLLNIQPDYYTLGAPIVQNILAPSCLERLTSTFNSPNSGAIQASLGIFHALSFFGGGQFKREAFDSFPWTHTSVPTLLHVRRSEGLASEVDQKVDPLEHPDIRTTLVLFVLSFLSKSTSPTLKAAVLEKRLFFQGIFSQLPKDPYKVVRTILDSLWEGVCTDPLLPSNDKRRVFGEQGLTHLAKLYKRHGVEGRPNDLPLAEIVHHFLKALFGGPGSVLYTRSRGLCFQENNAADSRETGPSSRISTPWVKLVSALLKELQPSDDARQEELALKIMEMYPELLPNYWTQSGMTLEPRLSSRWITNIAWVNKLISVPTPSTIFQNPKTRQYHSSPPPVQVLSNVLIPNTLSRSDLVQGLRSNSGLVKHLTATTLVTALRKFEELIQLMTEASKVLDEADVPNSWAEGRSELLQEVIRRLPDFAELDRLIHVARRGLGATEENKKAKVPKKGAVAQEINPASGVPNVQSALLEEVASRLMSLYHRLLRTESGDPQKGMMKSVLAPVLSEEGFHGEQESSPFLVAARLHGLRLLGDLEHYDWTLKTGAHTAIYHVLLHQLTSQHAAIRQASGTLLRQFLSRSVIFEHDSDEVDIWVSPMPRARREPEASTSDGTSLGDDAIGFLGFFDSCLSRCLKTPYRYLEEAIALSPDFRADESSTTSSPSDFYTPRTLPSPLLFTVIEQLKYRLNNEARMTSDTLAIFTFLRCFVMSLIGKQPDLRYATQLAETLEELLKSSNSGSSGSSLANVAAREVQILSNGVAWALDTNGKPTTDTTIMEVDMDELFDQDVLLSDAARYQTAKFADKLRFDEMPQVLDMVSLSATIIASSPFSRTTLSDFLLQVTSPEVIWTLVALENDVGAAIRRSVPFYWLFAQTSELQLGQEHSLASLSELFVAEAERTPASAMRNANMILLREKWKSSKVSPVPESLDLSVISILLKSLPRLSVGQAASVKRLLFCTQLVLKVACSETDSLEDTITSLRACLDPRSTEDRSLAESICSHRATLVEQNPGSLSKALPWISLMSTDRLLRCLDRVLIYLTTREEVRGEGVRFLEAVLLALSPANSGDLGTGAILGGRFSKILQVNMDICQSEVITKVLREWSEKWLPLTALPASGETVTQADTVVAMAKRRWRPTFDTKIFADISLTSPAGSDEALISASIAGLYLDEEAVERLAAWLCQLKTIPSSEQLPVVRAFLDVLHIRQDAPQLEVVQSSLEVLATLFTDLVRRLTDLQTAADDRSSLAEIVRLLFSLLPQRQAEFKRELHSAIEDALPASALKWDVLCLVHSLSSSNLAYTAVVSATVEAGLKWLVRRFAEDAEDSIQLLRTLSVFGDLVERAEDIKPYLAEPVLTAAIQNRLASRRPVELCGRIARAVPLKPSSVNRMIQSIVQHSSFYASVVDSSTDSSRDAIVNLLHILFNAHSSNTCQPNHIIPLIRAYRGTQSTADRQLLSLFHLFERQRRISVASLLSRWSSVSIIASKSAREAIASLDGSLVWQTFLSFPQDRPSAVDKVDPHEGCREDFYDPVFVMLLLACCAMEGSLTTNEAWVQLGRSNCISLAITALASRDGGIRRMAATVLMALTRAAEKCVFRDKEPVIYLLNKTRWFRAAPPEDKRQAAPSRLPTPSTLMLAHAMRCVFQPGQFYQPFVMRFMLQRPTFGLDEVPLMLEMLYNGEDDWKKRKTWIVQFMGDAMQASRDWSVFKKRHAWDMLATLFQESQQDASLRLAILQVLLRVTAHREPLIELILYNGLLNWMEIEARSLLVGEEHAVLLILENAIAFADFERLEKQTSGAWRFTTAQLLEKLLQRKGSLLQLQVASRLLLRLSILSSADNLPARLPLRGALDWLDSLESSITIHSDPLRAVPSPTVPKVPHLDLPTTTSSDASNPTDSGSDWIWGEIVENLWQATMALRGDETSTEIWNTLTMRLVVWNSIKRSRQPYADDDVGEWARCAVLGMMTPQA